MKKRRSLSAVDLAIATCLSEINQMVGPYMIKEQQHPMWHIGGGLNVSLENYQEQKSSNQLLARVRPSSWPKSSLITMRIVCVIPNVGKEWWEVIEGHIHAFHVPGFGDSPFRRFKAEWVRGKYTIQF